LEIDGDTGTNNEVTRLHVGTFSLRPANLLYRNYFDAASINYKGVRTTPLTGL